SSIRCMASIETARSTSPPAGSQRWASRRPDGLPRGRSMPADSSCVPGSSISPPDFGSPVSNTRPRWSRRSMRPSRAASPVSPVGALTVALAGETITEMGELAEAGCIAFSHADAALTDTLTLLRAMQYAATFGYRVWLRPQDAHLAKAGVAHDGEVATRLGLP